MATPSENLQALIDGTDAQIENLDAAIASVDEQLSEIDEQIDGVQNGLCEVAKSDLISYINDAKLSELESLHGGELPYSFSQGDNFGEIDADNGGITDWEILDNLGSLVYKYEDLNWDDDSTIIEKISDFAFGNKCLTKPLSGIAGYGLLTYKDFLVTSKAQFEETKDDLNQSKVTFSKYV